MHLYRCQLCGTVRALKHEPVAPATCWIALPVVGWSGLPNEQVVGVAGCKGLLEPLDIVAAVTESTQ